jgi:hypothetical protein
MAPSVSKRGKEKSLTGDRRVESFRFIEGNDKDSIKQSILNHLKYTLARDPGTAINSEWWTATCNAVRDRLLERFMKTQKVHHEKFVCCSTTCTTRGCLM